MIECSLFYMFNLSTFLIQKFINFIKDNPICIFNDVIFVLYFVIGTLMRNPRVNFYSILCFRPVYNPELNIGCLIKNYKEIKSMKLYILLLV